MKKQILLFASVLMLTACLKQPEIFPDKRPHPPVKQKIDSTTMPELSYVGIRCVGLANPVSLRDEDLFVFSAKASPQYVRGEDAPYLQGFGGISLSSLSSDGTRLAINETYYKFPKKTGVNIPLYLIVKNPGSCYFEISQTGNAFPSTTNVWLKDKASNDSTNLVLGSYTFTYVSLADTSRFSVTIK